MRFPSKAVVLLCVFLTVMSCRPVTAFASQSGCVVILDAGHGGEDGGAVSADGMPESVLNLQITQRLAALMILLGYDVMLTREGEDAVYSPDASTLREKKVSDLKNRAAVINAQERALVVSIHQNSLPDHPRVHGAKVFYNTVLPARQAAEWVQSAMNSAVNGGEERPVTPIDSTIYLMKESRHPAILVECGFMSNPEESRKLRDSDYQKRIVLAIAAGIGQFSTSEKGAVYES